MVPAILDSPPKKKAVLLWHAVVSAGSGVFTGLILVVVFGILSGFALSPERLIHVAGAALERGELPHTTRTNEDFFTECAMLEMQFLRPASLLHNVFDTRLVFPEDGIHPCQMLRTMVTQPEKDAALRSAARSYPNYPYGSRHLEAIVLSFLEIETARTVYLWISYLSILALAAAAWFNSKRQALSFLPLWLLLLFGFSIHFFGNNLAHAPGFISGFLALSIFLALKGRFSDVRARLLYFGVLGVVVSYFDILTGAIPVILSLSIVLNHFYYVDRRGPRGTPSWAKVASGVIGVTLCFVSAYVALALVRLGILVALNVDWHPYFRDLVAKFGSETAGEIIGLMDNISNLWDHRWQLTPGGAGPATWVIILSASSWLFALAGTPLVWMFHREQAAAVTRNVLVLIIAALGIAAWYDCFPVHTYQHVLFIVRTVTLPVSYGMIAAIIVGTALISQRHVWWVAAGFFLSFLAIVALLSGPWKIEMPPTIHSARFITATTDKVSCAALGLSPDGVPDGVVEIDYQPVKSPLSFVRRHVPRPIYIRLERMNPNGAHETGPTLYVLGISSSLKGELLNAKDGSFTPHDSQRVRFYGHFCRDGHDRPDSIYQINIDGSVFVLGRIDGNPN